MSATQNFLARKNRMKVTKNLRKSLVLTLSLTIAIPLLSAPTAQAAPNPTNYYQLDGNGTDSASGQNASVNGSISFPAGKYGNGYFAASPNSGFLNMGPNVGLFGAGNFTFGFWFKSAGGSGQLLNKRINNLQFMTIAMGSDGRIGTELRSPSASTGSDIFRAPATSGAGYNDGAWHHFALVRSGSTVTLYVDGQVSNTDSGLGDLNFNNTNYNSANFVFGASAQLYPGIGFVGSLDDLKIYYAALSQAEVNASMSGPAPAQVNQAALSVTSTSGTYLTPLALSTSGGSGTGAITFSASNGTASGCAISGSTLTSTSAGTCAVTATKAADSQYFAVSSTPTTVTFIKANQSELLITSVFGTVLTPLLLTASGGSIHGTYQFTAENRSASGCSVDGSGSLISTTAGTCVVTATLAGDSNYNSVSSAPTEVLLDLAIQTTPVVLDSASGIAGETIALHVSGGDSSGAYVFSVRPSSCSLNGNLLTASGITTCFVSVYREGDRIYSDSKGVRAQPVDFVGAPQPDFAVVPLTGIPGTPLTLQTSGGLSSGAVAFTLLPSLNGRPSECTLVGDQLFSATVAKCWVTATIAGDNKYLPADAAETTVFFSAINQAPLFITSLSGTFGTALPLTYSGSTVPGAVTFAVTGVGTASDCAIDASGNLTSSSAGTCLVTATNAGNDTYFSISSPETLITIAKVDQATLSVTSLSGVVLTPLTLTAEGGSTHGAVTFTASGGSATGCSVDSNGALISTTAGTCIVTATLAGDSNYNSVSSAPTEVSLSKLLQEPVTLVTVTGVAGQAVTLVGRGGSGTGAFVFGSAFKKTTGCSLSDDQLIAVGPVTCDIRLIKLGDEIYENSSDTVVPVVFSASGNELAIFTTPIPKKSSGFILNTRGGFGTGEVTFQLLSSTGTGDCNLIGTALGAPEGTTCVVQAIKNTDGTYGRQFARAEIYFRLSQPTLLTIDQSDGFVGTPLALTTTGGDGLGAVTFEVLGGDCTISGNAVLAASSGRCLVRAIKTGNEVYLDQEARAFITFIAVQTPVLMADGSATYGETINLVSTGGSGTGPVTYALADGATNSAGCSIAGTVLSATSVGTCSVIATNAGDSVYSAVSSNPATFTFGAKAVKVNIANGSKIYGEADPVSFTYTATGLIGSDALSGSLSRITGENVGTYAISGTLTNSNYVVTLTLGTFTINAKAATVTANSASKMYGEADPNLTYTASGLLPGDTFTGSLSRAAGETVGTYAIGLGNLRNNNYLITFNSATFTIKKPAQVAQAALVITSIRGKVESKIKLTTSGGSGTGAITYTVTNGTAKSCTITNGVLTAKGQGTCLVTALKAGDLNYLPASSVVTKVAFDSSNSENNGKKNDEDKSDSDKKDDNKKEGNTKDGSSKKND